jgi:hypothetical protein
MCRWIQLVRRSCAHGARAGAFRSDIHHNQNCRAGWMRGSPFFTYACFRQRRLSPRSWLTPNTGGQELDLAWISRFNGEMSFCPTSRFSPPFPTILSCVVSSGTPSFCSDFSCRVTSSCSISTTNIF